MTAVEGKTYQRTAHKTATVTHVHPGTGDVTYRDELGVSREVTGPHFTAEFGKLEDAPLSSRVAIGTKWTNGRIKTGYVEILDVGADILYRDGAGISHYMSRVDFLRDCAPYMEKTEPVPESQTVESVAHSFSTRLRNILLKAV